MKKNIATQHPDGCPFEERCGGCDYQGVPYEEQLQMKQKLLEDLLSPFCKVLPIVGMEDPLHYRHKVHAVLTRTRQGKILSGVYEAGTHKVVPVRNCRIENRQADRIIQDVRQLIEEFHLTIYNEDTGYGLFRHLMVRVGHATGEILLILVAASPVLPGKSRFVKAIRELHPEITSIVLNINDRKTSMVLGKRDLVLYGKGYIEDRLCGLTFRISPQSFYQVNPVQTEKLYRKALEYAGLTGRETVVDAYCGTGTIGLIAASGADRVIGVELNADAVKDARKNAERNGISNIRFEQGDAGRFLREKSDAGEKADVVILDPPRSGSTEEFMASVVKMGPDRVVYVSCDPETLARDLRWFTSHGYRAEEAQGFDCFAFTRHIETVCLLSNRKPDARVKIDVDLEDYYRIKDEQKKNKASE